MTMERLEKQRARQSLGASLRVLGDSASCPPTEVGYTGMLCHVQDRGITPSAEADDICESYTQHMNRAAYDAGHCLPLSRHLYMCFAEIPCPDKCKLLGSRAQHPSNSSAQHSPLCPLISHLPFPALSGPRYSRRWQEVGRPDEVPWAAALWREGCGSCSLAPLQCTMSCTQKQKGRAGTSLCQSPAGSHCGATGKAAFPGLSGSQRGSCLSWPSPSASI